MRNLQKLALVDAIKRQTSKADTSPEVFDKIVDETDILQIVKWAFEMDDVDEEVRELKCLACFVCVNLAMGNESTIIKIIDPKYGVLEHVNRALEANDTSISHL